MGPYKLLKLSVVEIGDLVLPFTKDKELNNPYLVFCVDPDYQKKYGDKLEFDICVRPISRPIPEDEEKLTVNSSHVLLIKRKPPREVYIGGKLYELIEEIFEQNE